MGKDVERRSWWWKHFDDHPEAMAKTPDSYVHSDTGNLYDKSAERHFAEELELCELLNRDAATEEGAEVDVDEMTGDILMG